ncbi:MAG TPA: BolA/IbaG family iron-sulfur metabolism protein [Acidobacteriota bacterium]|nr:BolA/IbaG family iron-sulfur metabolism protein [Acidobacteriota bacterium]HJN47691.1 BolA/IbaG family iron-sulfur metabolism protein [Acidobacteriota bacterium]
MIVKPLPTASTIMDPEHLKSLIETGIPGAHVSVQDLTGTRDHFGVQVVANAFAGKSLVEQHQMVYRAVGQELTNAVHALQVHTAVPEE